MPFRFSNPNFDEILSEIRQFFLENLKIKRESGKIPENAEFFFGKLQENLENCEIIHSRNLVEGIKLGEKTAHYPEGSKYLWNSEGLWPFERSLVKASPEEKEKLIEGVEKGYLRLDAGYANILSSDANGEELIEYLNYSRKYEKLTGTKLDIKADDIERAMKGKKRDVARKTK